MKRLGWVLVVLGLALTGCTSGDPEPDARPTLEPAPSVSNPLGECARETVIGLVPSPQAGSHERGAQLAIDLLNERASFFYELFVPSAGTDGGLRALLESDASAVIGTPTRTQAEILDTEGLTTLALTETEVVNSVGDSIFRLAATDIETVAEATDGLAGLNDYKDVAVLAGGGVPPRFAGKAFKDASLVTGDPNEAAASGADAVAVVTTPAAASKVVEALAESGHEGDVVVGPATSDADLPPFPGEVFVARPWDEVSPFKISEDFVAEFRSEFGEAPDLDSAYAYSAVILIARAVEDRCSNERAEIRREMAETRGATTLMGRFSFSANGAPRYPVVVFRATGNDLEPVGLTPN